MNFFDILIECIINVTPGWKLRLTSSVMVLGEALPTLLCSGFDRPMETTALIRSVHHACKASRQHGFITQRLKKDIPCVNNAPGGNACHPK